MFWCLGFGLVGLFGVFYLLGLFVCLFVVVFLPNHFVLLVFPRKLFYF